VATASEGTSARACKEIDVTRRSNDLLSMTQLEKTSVQRMAQVADLSLRQLAIPGYDERNRAYGLLRDAGRLIESRLPESQLTARGTKYSCFELIHRHMRGS
jgi:hypothetical protein